MQDPLLDPLRQRILARMGIQSWQLRAPLQAGGEPAQATADNAVPAPAQAPLPTGKLWLLAPTLPAASLLADICNLLGIGPDEVSLLGELPEGATPPLLWLTAADAHWPDALVCPLKPDAAHKRALWQQCRQRLPG
ncbi:DNA polymerase III subunit psi [Aeromonas sp. MR16]|uniref:DNA polymerase III subunit psi n=1 Tax=Aeromonas sp. MR16 TaxID=2923420 RepID=UPI001F4BB4CF|nr:DNA polymerase III subunit psi [Aeromonas sp. MR16]MCH7372640.1 DNA polymerase III subunit psi [Aeromonas sp. MR16]